MFEAIIMNNESVFSTSSNDYDALIDIVYEMVSGYPDHLYTIQDMSV
jgi:hypothetical protein